MKTKTTIHQKVSRGIVAALFVALSFCLLACNADQQNEEVIRKGVTEELDSLKNLEEGALDELVEGLSQSVDLTEYGLTNSQFCEAWFSGFDYKIENVAVDGSDATVTVQISIKSIMQAVTTWQEACVELAADQEAVAAMGRDELNQTVGTLLMESVEEAPMDTTTVDLPYVLEGNTWMPGDGFEAALSEAFVKGL